MLKKIIGIGHKARNGKDSTAKFLEEKLNGKCIILHFADALYEECKNLAIKPEDLQTNALIYNFGGEFFIKDKGNLYIKISILEPLGKKLDNMFNVRAKTGGEYGKYDGMEEKDSSLLQWWGTEFRRGLYGYDYWIKQLAEKIEALNNDPNMDGFTVVVPDDRSKNEFDFIKQFTNGVYVDVIRTHRDGSRYIAQDRDSNHISETDLDDVVADYRLSATDLTELEKETDKLINILKLNE